MIEEIYINDSKNILIPPNLKIGYKHRDNIYNNKLGYITYIDNKDNIKFETNWEGWVESPEKKYRNYINGQWEEIDGFPIEDFKNSPIEGFVLDKTAGGTYQDRVDYVRVVDPRGFTIEIRTHNLLYILSETNCLKGKGLEGSFVYGWVGASLFLIPVSNNYLYNKGIEYTKTIYTKNIQYKPSDINIGDLVLMNDNNSYVYVKEYINFYDSLNKKFQAKVFYNTNRKSFHLFKIFGNAIISVEKGKYTTEMVTSLIENFPNCFKDYYLYKDVYKEVNFETFENALNIKKNERDLIIIENDNTYLSLRNIYHRVKSFNKIETEYYISKLIDIKNDGLIWNVNCFYTYSYNNGKLLNHFKKEECKFYIHSHKEETMKIEELKKTYLKKFNK